MTVLSDMAANDVKGDALRIAFEAQVSKLFGVMCTSLAGTEERTGIYEEKSAILTRFNKGFSIAFGAYSMAMQAYTDAPSKTEA